MSAANFGRRNNSAYSCRQKVELAILEGSPTNEQAARCAAEAASGCSESFDFFSFLSFLDTRVLESETGSSILDFFSFLSLDFSFFSLAIAAVAVLIVGGGGGEVLCFGRLMLFQVGRWKRQNSKRKFRAEAEPAKPNLN